MCGAFLCTLPAQESSSKAGSAEGGSPQKQTPVKPESDVATQDAAHNQSAREAAIRQLRHRLNLVATRAIGYFHSADAIEAHLRSSGLSLHPETAVLRARLERSLDQADASVGRGDFAAALESLDLAEALVARFASKLGG